MKKKMRTNYEYESKYAKETLKALSKALYTKTKIKTPSN